MSLTGFTDPFVLAGLLSAALSTVAFLPYLRDTLTGKTRPQRASWLIWSVLGSIAFGSQVYEGATTSLAFAAVQVGGTLLVFALSVFVGCGFYFRRADWLTLAAAALGLGVWYFASSAAFALGVTISISLLGGVATIRKAYAQPHTETLSTWVIFLGASVLGVISVGRFDLILLAYPLYLLTLYSLIVGATLLGRMEQRVPPNAVEQPVLVRV